LVAVSAWERHNVKKWWAAQASDVVLRRIVRNLGYLFSANVMVAAIGLVTISITAHALGPLGLGIIALAEAYVLLVDQCVRLEPWQAVIRYGSIALENKREGDFRRIVKLSTLFDLFGGMLASFVAVVGCLLLGKWMGFDDGQKGVTIAYSLTLMLSVSSTPLGLLRLFDLFDVAAKLSVFLAICRLVLSTIAWFLAGGVWTFIIIMSVYQLFENLSPFIFAWRELRKRGHVGIWKTPLAGVLRQNPGILRFIINTNLNALVRLATQRVDTLIVGATLGTSAAGFYQLARRVGLAAVRIGRPLQQAVYPDLAKIWARGERQRFRRLVMWANASLTVVSLAAVIAAAFMMEFVVKIAFGENFLPVVPLVNLQLCAVALFLSGNTLGPALLSMGADKGLLYLTMAASVTFFVIIVPLLHAFGAQGAVISQVVFNLILLVGGWTMFMSLSASAPTIPDPSLEKES
jgi:O-antigen/teichoic acid export membrane protein